MTLKIGVENTTLCERDDTTQSAAESTSVPLPGELNLLAEVIADLIAREYLKEMGILTSGDKLP